MSLGMNYVAAVFDDQECGKQGGGLPEPQRPASAPENMHCLGTFVSLPLARSACALSEHGVLRWWEGPDGSWQAAGRGHVYRVFAEHGAAAEHGAGHGAGSDGPLEQAS